MDLGFIEQAWRWLGGHPLLLGAGLLVVSLLAAKAADLVFTRLLRGITRLTTSAVDDAIINQLHRPVQATVLLLGALVAVWGLMEAGPGQERLAKAVYTVLLALWTAVAVRFCRTLFRALMRAAPADSAAQSALPLMDNVLTVVLLALGAFWLFELWQINVTPLLASAGIVTAAVALASKDTLANFFGGVSIFMDRPYRLGDYIILESGERGEVVGIGVRSTRLLTRDDVLITVPNAVMANAKIINESGMVPRYRVRAAVGVAYDSDLDAVERELLAALENVAEVLAEPPPRVRFRAFGDSALQYELLAWVQQPADRGRVLHEINRNIHRRLAAAGIEIPFPQRVVHLPGPTTTD
jgi:small-conductance mechanosensitive channel